MDGARRRTRTDDYLSDTRISSWDDHLDAPLDGARRRRRTDDYLRDTRIPSRDDLLDAPLDLSAYGFFPSLIETYTDHGETIRGWRYTAVEPTSNKRARVAEDDATLRWQLPEVAARSGDDNCAICLQDLAGSPEEEAKATPRAMPCSHAFHEHCIFQWIRRIRACPLCRRPLPTPLEQEYDYADDDRLQLTMPVPREMLDVEVL